MNRKTKKRLINAVRFVILLFFLLLVILPIYWMLVTSFKTNVEIVDTQHITYFPKVITTENYKSLFNMLDYGVYLKNSIVITLATALFIVILSILGGYGLARYKFKGKSSILLFFLVTQMIPSILVIIPLYIVYAKVGIINTRLSLFIFYAITNLPFCVITMRSFFERIPYSLEEAAWVDGCADSSQDYSSSYVSGNCSGVCFCIYRCVE